MKSILFSVLFLVSDWTKAVKLTEWPYGIYGLPRAKSGCPTSDRVKWSSGLRFQDMNNKKPYRSDISPKSHMDAKVDFSHMRDITRHFCVKTKFGYVKRNWPKGSYCVYKNSKSICPHGMTQGWVRWDDEDDDNANRKQGVLPDGQYDHDTILRYCCQEQGQWYNSIELPTDRPFYLLPHNSSLSSPVCQLVKWALTWLEFIVYDTESNNNGDRSSGSHVFIRRNDRGFGLLKVYYCYYEGCRYEMTAPYGTFRSPKSEFSGDYPTFQYCSWLITVGATFVVSLNFTSFYVPNCDNNFVKIYDGVNDSAPILATYCGLNATSESKIISSTNNVYVKVNFGSYSSNNSRISSNFQAEYRNATDKDECLTSPCHIEATCQNTIGSYTCSCQNGFTGDGKSCTDKDECLTSPCHIKATCQNTIGSYTCSCQNGSTGDGKSCIVASKSSSSSSKSDPVVIVGAVVGGVLFWVVILLVAFNLYRRNSVKRDRKKRNKEERHHLNIENVSFQPQPRRSHSRVPDCDDGYETPGDYAALDNSRRVPRDDNYQGLIKFNENNSQSNSNPETDYTQLSKDRDQNDAEYTSLNLGKQSRPSASTSDASHSVNQDPKETIYEEVP